MGEWDDYNNRYHPSQRGYKGYEISSETRRRVDIIAEQVKVGYPDERTCRKDADWLEGKLHELKQILANEESIGYNNVTLKHDLKKIRSLLGSLSEELDRLDQ